jgi:hypothetical protein
MAAPWSKKAGRKEEEGKGQWLGLVCLHASSL